MSLSNADYLNVIKNQYLYKLKTNFTFFYSIIFCQIIGILSSFIILISSGSNNISINILNSTAVIFFTLVSIAVVSSKIINNKYKNLDFAFVTNSLTSNISNILFLITLCTISAITAVLSSCLIRVILYLFSSSELIVFDGFILSASDLFLDFVSCMMLSLIVSSLSYFIGSLINKNKMFGIILIVVIFGIYFSLISYSNVQGSLYIILRNLFYFFLKEHSLLIYSVKILLTSFILYGLSSVITDKSEVRL